MTQEHTRLGGRNIDTGRVDCSPDACLHLHGRKPDNIAAILVAQVLLAGSATS